jgi:bifunctional non-homologous end joining protein LigD
VSFGEWTRDGRVRHSVFHGLREDKPPKSITKEKAVHEAPVDKPAKAAATRLPSTLRISNPDRVVDADSGLRKIDLVRYYALVGEFMMAHLKGRPIALVRAPDGIAGQMFFQKHLERYKMPGVVQIDTKLVAENPPMLEIAKPEGLLSAAQMNVIEVHTWNGTKSGIGKPDRMTFDIDPGEGVTWPQIQEAASLVRTLLDELELPVFLKTSGGKGLHLVVPLRRQFDWDTVKDFSEAIVLHLARTLPDRFVAKSGPKNRVGRIFIDYLRNGYGATTVCAWSARARAGMGISVPVRWDELGKLKSGAHWTVATVHQRLDQGNEPWADYESSRTNLSAAMKKLGFERS